MAVCGNGQAPPREGRLKRFLMGSLTGACLLGDLSPAGVAHAQPDVPGPTSTACSVTKIYRPEDFVRYAPNTALDMLNQVPGFLIKVVEERRGLGDESGNVLVNGQRVSGKSNDAEQALNRVPAADVLRIEICDGTAAGVSGAAGQTANVIVRPKGRRGQYTWRPQLVAPGGRPSPFGGEASISGLVGPIGYTLGI